MMLDLCDDVLGAIVSQLHAHKHPSLDSKREAFRETFVLTHVCKHLNQALRPALVGAAEAASKSLFSDQALGERGPMLLDLTGKELQALDCTLLAHALRHPARSGLESVQVMWLQNNRIDACGLQALARGLRAMPEGCCLKSIALGGNAFHATIKEAGAGAKLPRSLRRALRELENAAAERKVRIRLHS